MKNCLLVIFMLTASCMRGPDVRVEGFGQLSDGQQTHLFTISNSSGASMSLCDYGARIVSIRVPDRNGLMGDVIVGPVDIGTFENADRFMGCTIGRYANRIEGPTVTIDGVDYQLETNETLDGVPVQCHSGVNGIDRFVWDGKAVSDSCVRFTRTSPDGEGGFPGNCNICVSFTLTGDNVCIVEYEATTDKPTFVNLSNHSYFNMRGSSCYVMEQVLEVEADSCIRNNSRYCPDSVVSVEGTPFDFRTPHRVDYRIDMPDPHLALMHGMSACWIIRDWDGTLKKAVVLYDPVSGRGVEVRTTEPCLLTYTGRGFNGSMMGKTGPIDKFAGMLLETIHAADSPHQERFPGTLLCPGESFTSTTQFRFFAQ